MINTLDLNIEDSRQVDASCPLKNENNFSQNDTTTRSTFINSHDLNIDTKSESLLLSQPSDKSNQIDFMDVNKLKSIVKPLDTNLLNSKSLSKKKAKREASVLDLTNTNDTKRIKMDQSIAFNNSTNSSTSKINSSCFKTSHAEENKYSCETCGKNILKII